MCKQTHEHDPKMVCVTAVQVATVWTNPESARPIDADGTANPTDVDAWIAGLTYETNLALCDENRVQTQLLYGEPVIITATKDDWAHVVIPTQPSGKDERGYPGWVPLNQLAKVDKKAWRTEETVAITHNKAWLENEAGEKQWKLSFMTLLPLEKRVGDRVQVQTPQGSHFLQATDVKIFPTEKGIKPGSGEQIAQTGAPFIGLDYFWGGMSAFGYDCSGLAYAVHKANGYKIARDAGDQAAKGKVIEFDQLKPGDLVFFAYEEGKGGLHHVGIYYGDGKMLHAPQTGKGIELTTINGTIYEKELCAARRYWLEVEENKHE